MKKLILLLGFLFICSNALATETLVLTEQNVGIYKNGEIIPEKNPNLFVHRIKINETFQLARIIEQTNPSDQTKLDKINDKYTISYIYSGLPTGTKDKVICLTRTLPLAIETILINTKTFQFISVTGEEIVISEGVVQKVLEEKE